MMKTRYLVFLLSMLIFSGCVFCPGKEEALMRAKTVSKERLSVLFEQLVELKENSDELAIFEKDSPDDIPPQFSDLGVRKICLHGDGAYLSFWFCMDEGIQYDVSGLEGNSDPKIDLSWGEPGTNSYREETLWSKSANKSIEGTAQSAVPHL